MGYNKISFPDFTIIKMKRSARRDVFLSHDIYSDTK